jgi:AAHS family 4-hydroxybenzoate transporter-like MFS transporter
VALPTTIDLPSLIDQQKIGRLQIRLLVLCFAILVTHGYDLLSIGIVAPSLAQALHIAKPALGPIFSVGAFGAMLGALFAGPLADHLGRRRVVIASTLFYGICALLTARAMSIEGLLLLRFATGLGLGGAFPNTVALMSEFAPRRARGTVITLMQTGFAVGAALSGVIVAWLVDKYGWRTVFYVGGLVPLLLTPLLIAWLPESIGWLVVKGAPVSTVVTILSKINPRLRFARDTTFIMREENHPGVSVFHLFREGRAVGTTLLWIAFITNVVAVNFLAVWLPTLITTMGMAVRIAAWAAVGFHVGSIVGAVLLGKLADLRGAYRVLPINLATGAVIAWLAGLAGSSSSLVLALSFGMGFCIAGGQLGLSILSSGYYPTYIRATGVAWAFAIAQPGAVISGLLGTLFLTWRWSLPTIFLVDGSFALCAAAAIFVMGASQYKTAATVE